jgi:hypothetical protein
MHLIDMMRLPTIRGLIRRRILVNWRVDPAVIQRLLPAPFRPKLHGGHAVAGLCLIRLEQIRPRFVPAAFGIASENAAHRIAVSWTDEQGALHDGVYIARRDTGSRLNYWLGGRLFPGEHHHARFEVRDEDDALELSMRSLDGEVEIELAARTHATLPVTSCFGSLEQASAFFEGGSLGYSETGARRHLDGVRLVTAGWSVTPLAIDRVRSTFFDDIARFPRGSAELDCALVMRDLTHEWQSAPDFPLERTG